MGQTSEGARKAAQTKKERYGTDVIKGWNSAGGKHRTRGYFGKLKDEGKLDELAEVSKKGGKAFAEDKEASTKARKKAWETRRSKSSGDVSTSKRGDSQ